jgi:hypothetical protein
MEFNSGLKGLNVVSTEGMEGPHIWQHDFPSAA